MSLHKHAPNMHQIKKKPICIKTLLILYIVYRPKITRPMNQFLKGYNKLRNTHKAQRQNAVAVCMVQGKDNYLVINAPS